MRDEDEVSIVASDGDLLASDAHCSLQLPALSNRAQNEMHDAEMSAMLPWAAPKVGMLCTTPTMLTA